MLLVDNFVVRLVYKYDVLTLNSHLTTPISMIVKLYETF